MSQDIKALEIARNVKPRHAGAFLLGPNNQDCFAAADCIIAQVAHIEALERQLADLRQAERQAPEWISVADRLPEDRQAVMFVVDCKAAAWDYLNGRVFGGTFVANHGFSIPGLTIGASHWKPSPAAPSAGQAKPDDAGQLAPLRTQMILCETCGNKRCPHANDKANACTGSNEPGQPGSAYP